MVDPLSPQAHKERVLLGASIYLALRGGGVPPNPYFAPPLSKTEFFLDRLSEWTTSIPLTTQFCVYIHSFPRCISDIQNREPGITDDDWNILQALKSTTRPEVQDHIGCIFAHGVSMPGEELDIESLGPETGGYVKGPIVHGRTANEPLRIEFLETNTSFADLVIRPWIIMTAHNGLFAYNERDIRNVKTNISVHQYAKTGAGKRMVERRITTFFGCAPVSLGSEEYNYTGDTVVYRSVNFNYNYYTVSDNSTANIDLFSTASKLRKIF